MTRDSLQAPTTRTWRDIPQPVVPRAMSKGGRWRLTLSALRVTGLVVVGGVCVWGALLVGASMRENRHELPAVAKATPIKAPVLQTDGVLDNAWLAQALGLPKTASLMDLDLEKLRSRLLEDEQVINATLTRSFPDRLIVQITERTPVARVKYHWFGEDKQLLVARDGVIYGGHGYDTAITDSLPWLDGVDVVSDGAHFRPIRGMPIVAELLGKCRLEAEQLYNTWDSVSLARLQSDSRIEIRTKDGAYTEVFAANDDFFRQLVKLSYICDKLAARAPGAVATIDLTLGQDVPVMVNLPEPEPTTHASAGRVASERRAPTRPGQAVRSVEPHSSPAMFVFPQAQPKQTKREL